MARKDVWIYLCKAKKYELNCFKNQSSIFIVVLGWKTFDLLLREHKPRNKKSQF